MKLSFDYPNIEPPFGEKNIEELSKQEVKEYFIWFKGIMPAREILLRKAILNDIVNFDVELFSSYNPIVLDDIWNWAINIIGAKWPTEDEFEKLKANHKGPKYITDSLEKWQFIETSLATKILAWDIGLYFGKVFIKNINNTDWSINSKEICVGSKKHNLNPIIIVHYLFELNLIGKEKESKKRSPLKRYYDQHSKMMIN